MHLTDDRGEISRARHGRGTILFFGICGVVLGMSLSSPRLRANFPATYSNSSDFAIQSSVSWPLAEPFKVTEKDLGYGEQQVEQMVRDRPEMAQGVNRDSPIWRWCARQFAGAGLGQRIRWDNHNPMTASYGADSQGPADGEPASIRVSKTLPNADSHTFHASSCEELWSGAAFELNNLSSDAKFKAIYEAALAGKLTKEAWIEQNTRVEYLTGLKTELVYEHLWPNASTSDERRAAYWGERSQGTYEDWISRYTDHSGYPWDSWGRYFDDEITPYLNGVAK